MFTNIHSITISVLVLFLVCSAQSMEKEVKYACYEDQFFKGYGESDMSASKCLDDEGKNIDDGYPRSSLYESILSDDVDLEASIYESMSHSECFVGTKEKLDSNMETKKVSILYLSYFNDLDEVMDEIDKKETERYKELDGFIVIEPINCNMIKAAYKPEKCLDIVDDYENPSPNASPINLDSTEPVASDWQVWAKDMVSLASDKLAPVGDYLHALNKDIAKI